MFYKNLMLKKHFLAAMLSVLASWGFAHGQMDCASPVNYEIILAGNFGEPRPNHFHGGIDVKTERVEGKPIFSIADGYVERLTVGLYGFGNAVFVRHPEGYTSVYCHLKKFAPALQAALRRWQYSHESFQADVHLRATDCPVAKGQLIALSGNTGSSQAPHLHLEIHDTRTWNMLDPLDFLKPFVRDATPPQAHAFMAYPMPGEGVFNGGATQQYFGFSSHQLTREFTAWGRVGFGLWANDYMEQSYNNYGIRQTILTVDGREVFRSDVNNIPMDGNLMVNSWGDYQHYLHSNVWYMRSYLEPGNTLPILRADENRGIIDFNEERNYQLKYTLIDFAGNTSEYEFTVRGEKRAIPPAQPANVMRLMQWNRVNHLFAEGAELVLPKHVLAKNVELSPRSVSQPSRYSDAFTPQTTGSFPLLSWARLRLKCHASRPVSDSTKLYVVSHWGTDRYMGGKCKNGWVEARVRELAATYEVEYDDQPPLVNAMSLGQRITIGLSDAKSGISTYKGYVDGQFVLFEEVAKSPWVSCDLTKTPVKRTGKPRKLRFVARDNCNNERIYEAQFTY